MSSLTLTGALSDRDSWSADECPLAAALSVVGRGTSMLLLLREALYGATRFEEFVRRAQVSEKAAAMRLHELVDQGLLTRKPYSTPGKRSREGYELTPKGEALLPAIVALMQWGDRWVIPTNSGRIQLEHDDCGHSVSTELCCSDGHSIAPGSVNVSYRGGSTLATHTADEEAR